MKEGLTRTVVNLGRHKLNKERDLAHRPASLGVRQGIASSDPRTIQEGDLRLRRFARSIPTTGASLALLDRPQEQLFEVGRRR